jgi:hypothetical protein
MRHALTLIAVLASCTFVVADDPPKPAPKGPDSASFELRLSDGSSIKAVILDEKIDIQTRYGRLSVPFADVQKIEFGPRLTAEAVKKLETAVANLNSPTESTRETAANDLLKAGVAAITPLTRAAKASNPELAAKARDMLEKVRESLGDEKTVIHTEDAIYTEGFTVVGKIETPMLKVRTGHFGELTLKVADLRGVRAPNYEGETVAINALPDPGSMTNYNNQIGKTFYFTVTGTNNGALYGTGVHTTDSTVATAAVHGGILKLGQTGIVKVTMVASPQQFIGSTQNGITSSNWGVYPAAYKISKP